MFPVVIRAADVHREWFTKVSFDKYVLQLEDTDIVDSEYNVHSQTGADIRILRDLYKDKHCVGVKFPANCYIDDYAIYQDYFKRVLYTCRDIARYENSPIPIIIKVRNLFSTNKAAIKSLVDSFSSQFTFCKQPLILEPEHFAIDLQNDLYESIRNVPEIAKLYTEYAQVHRAYSCFNVAYTSAMLHIIDLLGMNECGSTKHDTVRLKTAMSDYADTCMCAILSHSIRYGLLEHDYMCGFTQSHKRWLKDAIVSLRSVLNLDDNRIFIEVHDEYDDNRRQLISTIRVVQEVEDEIRSMAE